MKKSSCFIARIDIDIDFMWHVVRVFSGKELQIAKALEPFGIPVFCPMQVITTIIRGNTRQQLIALFSTYIFVDFPTEQSAHVWHVINDQAKLVTGAGILEVLGDNAPVPLPDGLVEEWQERANEDGVIVDLQNVLMHMRYGFKQEDEVYIANVGAYNSVKGVCVWLDHVRKIAGVKISLLGREIVLERSVRDITKADAGPPALRRKRGRRGGERSRMVRRRYQEFRHIKSTETC